jgi:hypothetical protein
MSAKRKLTKVEKKAVKMSLRVRVLMKRRRPNLYHGLYLEGFKGGILAMMDNLEFARSLARKERLIKRALNFIK